MMDYITPQNVLIVLCVSLVVFLVYVKYFKEQIQTTVAAAAAAVTPLLEQYAGYKHMDEEEMRENLENTLAAEPAILTGEPAKDLEKTSTLLPTDLLPDYTEATSFTAGNAVTDLLKSQNFIIGSFPQGLDTVATAKRIPYYDIRSNYPVPKEEYPWNNSPYEQPPGSGRKEFQIGN